MILQPGEFQYELQSIATAVRALAQSCPGDSLALLALLRQLEKLHREIRDGMFQASLPDNRQTLYALLRDIESQGGWPYIERMKLQSFLANLELEQAGEPGDRTSSENSSGDASIKPDWLSSTLANLAINLQTYSHPLRVIWRTLIAKC